MTRRKNKHAAGAFYFPAGNAGEVWVAWGYDFYSGTEDSYPPYVMLDVFANEQIANQYASWYHRANGGFGDGPRATKRIIRTKMESVRRYNPATRKRCANSAWQRDRKVRILAPDFGYGNKLGTIHNVDSRYVYVEIRTGKAPQDCDVVAYRPEHLRLVAK
jgi:hypothetical protein